MNAISENRIEKFFWPLVTCQKSFFEENFEKISFLSASSSLLNSDCYCILLCIFYCIFWCEKVVLVCVAPKVMAFLRSRIPKKYRNFRVNQFEWIPCPIKEYGDIKIVKSNIFSHFAIQFTTLSGRNYEILSIPFR